MGLGKSICAVAVSLDQIKDRQVIILLTKSLQQNMRSAIKKYVKMRGEVDPLYHVARLPASDLEEYIEKNFKFVSLNANNMITQMKRAAENDVVKEFDVALEKKLGEVLALSNLDGKLLIVDEAHNLFRAITNGSKNAKGLYDLIMKSKNLKLVFLTGTPISNDVFELVPCFNMLGSSRPNVAILPEFYEDFKKLYVGNTGFIKNKEKFQNRIFGLTSRVTHHSTPGAKAIVGEAKVDPSTIVEFPEELPIEVIKVNMDQDQWVMYSLAREKEKEESLFKGRRNAEAPSMQKPKSSASSSYRVKSRQLSNYCPQSGYSGEKDPSKLPSGVTSPKFRAILKEIDERDSQLGLVYSQFVGIGGLGSFQRFLQEHNWHEVSPPLITKKKSPGQIIEEFEHAAPGEEGELDESVEGAKDVTEYISGIETEANIGNNWWLLGANDDATKDTASYSLDSDIVTGGKHKRFYAVISGKVPVESRAYIQDMYNSAENMHGGIIDLLLISSTGAEGLDLKNVRHIHITEPYWNWGRIAQIKARGIRNDSHKDLPANEKNVATFVYLAIPHRGRTRV